MISTHFSKNGEIFGSEDAFISLDNIEYSYGYGVYETLKVRKGVLFFAEQHAERLLHSADLIELQHTLTVESIINQIHNLVKFIKVESCNIKVMLIGGETAEGATVYVFATNPLYPDRKLYKIGAATITFEYERWLPNAKSLNMLPSYIIYKKAIESNCYDGLLIDRNGCIREGTRTNFFIIKGKTVISPPTDKILEGVTRKTIIAVLKQACYDYEEKEIPLQEIGSFDGAFLSSTSTKIIPIRQIDELKLTIPDSIRDIMKRYDNFLQNCNGVFPE